MISNQVLLCSILFKIVAMFIGVCGNIVVIILTRTSKFWSKEKRETSYLVGNLALADLLMCLTLYPAWIVEFTLTILDIESDQLLFCKFSRSFTFTFLFASLASLLAITEYSPSANYCSKYSHVQLVLTEKVQIFVIALSKILDILFPGDYKLLFA